jgi:hypothetical protein
MLKPGGRPVTVDHVRTPGGSIGYTGSDQGLSEAVADVSVVSVLEALGPQ